VSTISTPPTPAPRAVIRYMNQLGAIVEVNAVPATPPERWRGEAFTARCTACLDQYDDGSTQPSIFRPREWANKHAADCRALPQPEHTDQPGGTE
jgi:hypothetical protein